MRAAPHSYFLTSDNPVWPVDSVKECVEDELQGEKQKDSSLIMVYPLSPKYCMAWAMEGKLDTLEHTITDLTVTQVKNTNEKIIRHAKRVIISLEDFDSSVKVMIRDVLKEKAERIRKNRGNPV